MPRAKQPAAGMTREELRDEALSIAAERDEKAAESFMMADMLLRNGQSPEAWLMAGKHAERTAVVLRALVDEVSA